MNDRRPFELAAAMRRINERYEGWADPAVSLRDALARDASSVEADRDAWTAWLTDRALPISWLPRLPVDDPRFGTLTVVDDPYTFSLPLAHVFATPPLATAPQTSGPLRSEGARYWTARDAIIIGGWDVVTTHVGACWPALTPGTESVLVSNALDAKLLGWTRSFMIVREDAGSVPVSRRFDEAIALVGEHSFQYGHWLLDYLPRALAIGEVPPDVPVVVDADLPANSLWWLRQIVGPRPVVALQRGERAAVETVIVPLSRTFCPTGWVDAMPINPEVWSTDPRAVGQIQAHAARAADSTRARTRRLFLGRRGGHRLLVNKEELFDRVAPLGFELVYAEDLAMPEFQSILDSTVDLIVPAGAQLLNLMAARPGLRVLVLAGYGVEEARAWALLTPHASGHAVALALGSSIDPATRSPYQDVQRPYRVDLEVFDRAVAEFCGGAVTTAVGEAAVTHSLPPRPRLTVIMSTFNQQDYVADAIDSVLAQQTTFPIQLIVTDDASSDRTLEAVDRYQQAHPHIVKVLRAAQNGGYYANVLRAKALTDTDYFCLLDADDYWIDPHKLQRAFDFMEAHPDFVIHATNCFCEAPDGQRTLHIAATTPDGDYSFDDYLRSRAVIPQTAGAVFRNVLFKSGIPKVFSDAVGTRAGLSFSCDSDRFAFHLERGKARFENVADAVYRVHGTGMWSGLNAFERAVFEAESRLDHWHFYFDHRHTAFFLGGALHWSKRGLQILEDIVSSRAADVVIPPGRVADLWRVVEECLSSQEFLAQRAISGPVDKLPVSWTNVEAANAARVDADPEQLVIETPATPWTFAALLPLPDAGTTPVAVRVTLTVHEGRLGVGLLRNINEMAVEESVGARDSEQTVELPVSSPADTWRLVIRNHENPGVARCTIREIAQLVQVSQLAANPQLDSPLR